ncbi:MAG: hypothetical protein C4523_02300 [Myxococcales bacterium]|nr:MAG: hypothetical protein C4523_02300 [Myxococcales bacterium]
MIFCAAALLGSCSDSECAGCADGDIEPDGDSDGDAGTDGDVEPDADGDEPDGDAEPEADSDEPDGDAEPEAEPDTDIEDGEQEGEEEVALCSGVCDPQSDDASFCPDGFAADALCLCDAGTSTWTPVSCAAFCAGEGFVGSLGCGLSLRETLYDCLCARDCEDAEAVQTDCMGMVYTDCTCGTDDPCAWAGNGICDATVCAMLYPGNFFDDSADCDEDCGDVGAVAAMCAGATLNNCTCAAADPCAWTANGACDDLCAQLYPDDHFDDPECE